MDNSLSGAWTRVVGSNTTFAAAADSDFPSSFTSVGTPALVFDESGERYDADLGSTRPGRFSLFFFDNAADSVASAFVGVLAPGGQNRIGVVTDVCPDEYYYSVNAGLLSCTRIKRRTGWHRVDMIRDGSTSKGYLDNELVYEEINPAHVEGFRTLVMMQDSTGSGDLQGFQTDDVTFTAIEPQ